MGIPLKQIWAIVWGAAGIVALVAGLLWGARNGVQFALTARRTNRQRLLEPDLRGNRLLDEGVETSTSSPTCRPMVSTGLRAVSGSWKIIEISLPRIRCRLSTVSGNSGLSDEASAEAFRS